MGFKPKKVEASEDYVLMRYIVYILFFCAVGFFTSSCADEIVPTNSSIPQSFGKVNELTILADQAMWDGPVGDTTDYYFTGAFPMTPTPEPMLDLRHFNFNQISKSTVFKHYRSYVVLANLSNKESQVTQMVIQDLGEERYRRAMKDPSYSSIVGKNKWAKGQIVIYLFAPTESQLIDVVKAKMPDVVARVYEHDIKQISANTFASGENVIAQNTILEMMQVSSKIPDDFKVAKKSLKDNMIWLRKDVLDKSIENIVVQSIPYHSEKQFEVDSIIALFNRFGSTHIEDNEIQVNDRDLPTYEYVRSEDGKYVKEIRGIWESTKSYMGGPYIACLIKDKDSENLIFAMSFIFAPGETKRNLIQRNDMVLRHLSSKQENN